MASDGRKDASRENEEGHDASVDEIIEIGDSNDMLADFHSSNNSFHEHNVEAEHHVSNNKIEYYSTLEAFANNIKGKLESAPPSNFAARHCIYRVHEKLRKINESAYTPMVVSIGPFHHGDKRLQAMEQCKLIYTRDLLSRSTEKAEPHTMLEECLESIRGIEEEARSCYSEPIKLNSSEFVEMMLIDGLFIIELICRHSELVTYDHDPIFSTTWQKWSIVRDMALLENQLPMLVLDRLLNLPALQKQLKGHPFMMMLAVIFFNQSMRRDVDKKALMQNLPNCDAKHLLDLLGKTYHPSSPPSADKMPSSLSCVPSATELCNAGVKFKKGSTKASFLDIKFSNGVLEIPPLVVNDRTDSLLRNLIAHEQCSIGDANYFASYTRLMDELINSADDVRLLRKPGIITNFLGSDKDVAELFNKLSNEVAMNNMFYYSQLQDQVNTYYKKRSHVWRATLKRDYFNSPWTTISVVAAILLIVLTFTATTFAILSFFIHKS